jgi:Vitamin B6 photo-protection and homoeostasis
MSVSVVCHRFGTLNVEIGMKKNCLSLQRYTSNATVRVWNCTGRYNSDHANYSTSLVGRRNAVTNPTSNSTKNPCSSKSLLVYEHRTESAFDRDNWQEVPKAFLRIADEDADKTGGPVWKQITTSGGSENAPQQGKNALSKNSPARQRFDLLVAHFLPVGYPRTVAPYYREYALHTFIASIAGSASMVLSTQSLLLAIGVVGATQAGILAGAINWVLKDGLSQAGAILWTSVAARNYDEHPKTWRMVAAIVLDIAAAIELVTPFLTEIRGAVLVAACAAGTLKNIGFLTASASRAAIHQALTHNGRNLADVTAKAGSQSIAAGLLGTSLGLAASHVLQGRPDILLCYGGCFIGLATIHQSFNYFAVKSIAFNRLDFQRAYLVLDHFISDRTWLDPVQVSQQEPILFQTRVRSQSREIQVGVGIEYHPNATFDDDSRFLLSKNGHTVYITFMKEASPFDQIVALYQALLLKKGLSSERVDDQDLLDGLANAQWDIEGTELEPRGTSIRISVDPIG